MSEDQKYIKLSDKALDLAFESYVKAKKLDTGGQYSSDILINVSIISEEFYNVGVSNYNRGEFLLALSDFKNSLRANEILGVDDSQTFLNAALTAEIANEYEEAKKYYSKLIDLKFDNPEPYNGLGRIYLAQGDTKSALNFIVKGRELFPDDFTLLINEINIYLISNQAAKATNLLEKAILVEKTNPTLFFALGVAYEQLRLEQLNKSLESFEKIEKLYSKAIDLNHLYFDAYYNLGALYVNEAAALIEKANAIPYDRAEEERYNSLIAAANELLFKAVPVLEAALEIEPDDFNTMHSLKEIYARLENPEKLQVIEKHIEKYQPRK